MNATAWKCLNAIASIALSMGKNLLEGQCGPKSQSIEAVKALLVWKGRAVDPLPEFVEIGKGENRLVLVLSNKKDVYYTTTAKDCSCPSNTFRNGICKHQRKYFPSDMESIKPLGGWVGPDGKKANGPVEA